MVSVCQVISQDHVIKERSYDLMGGSPSSSAPVDTRYLFNVYKALIRRLIDVETSSCVYESYVFLFLDKYI